jgi:hypothetical protein
MRKNEKIFPIIYHFFLFSIPQCVIESSGGQIKTLDIRFFFKIGGKVCDLLTKNWKIIFYDRPQSFAFHLKSVIVRCILKADENSPVNIYVSFPELIGKQFGGSANIMKKPGYFFFC